MNAKGKHAQILSVLLGNQRLVAPLLSSSSESDDSDEELMIHTLHSTATRRRSRTRTDSIPTFRSDASFRSQFRMSRSVFDEVLNKIGDQIVNHRAGQPTVPAEKQLMMALWFLSNQESYSSIANRFDVAKSTMWHTFDRVVLALQKISPEEITWPFERATQTTEDFARISGFPRVIGVVDKVDIPVKAPADFPQAYKNKSNFHSVVLQAVCDAHLKFTDCFAGCPGSLHINTIFTQSPLFRSIAENKDAYFPDDTHLLGNMAYPTSDILIAPFKDTGHLSDRQLQFNNILSATSVKINNAFALLKGRFCRLKLLDMSRVDMIPAAIIAACVLHNICLDHDTNIQEYLNSYEEINFDFYDTVCDASASQTAKRVRLLDELCPV